MTQKEAAFVLELQQQLGRITGCYARPDALDALAVDAALALRVAPDEMLVVVGADDPTEQRLQALLDPDGLTYDLSGGYTVWRLGGEGRNEAFARLCAIPLPQPPAFVQGLFAGVPAKILVQETQILLLVTSVVGHHVRGRILKSCADLAPRELPATVVAAPQSEKVA